MAILGVDFGTTNSGLAVARAKGQVETIGFPDGAGHPETWPSMLFLEPGPGSSSGRPNAHSGRAAIERYFGAERGRLM